MNTRFFLRSFVVWLIVVIILERWGIAWDLFARGFYYDKLLHFLGGLTAGLAGLLWLTAFARGNEHHEIHLRYGTKSLFVFALAFAFVIGIAWEILQYYWPWLRDFSDQTWQDTLGDIVFDTLGGLIAAGYALLRSKEEMLDRQLAKEAKNGS